MEHSTPEKRHANPTRDGDVFFEIDGLDSASDGYIDSQDDSDSNGEENGDIDELGKYLTRKELLAATEPLFNF